MQARKKVAKDSLKGQGIISIAEILANAIKIQAISVNGHIKYKKPDLS